MGLALEMMGWAEALSLSCKAHLKHLVLLSPLVLRCPLYCVSRAGRGGNCRWEDGVPEGASLWRKQGGSRL